MCGLGENSLVVLSESLNLNVDILGQEDDEINKF